MDTRMDMLKDKTQLTEGELVSGFSPYPMDMSSFLGPSEFGLDAAGVPYHEKLAVYNPTTIAQYALAHWNEYLATGVVHHYKTFLIEANWLIEHEMSIDDDAGGWPIAFPHPNVHGDSQWLSALTQGTAISVLVRAYRLTSREIFLEGANRAVRTFERDILDGGVSTPIGEEGIFFEEVAVYPAMHILSGFIFSLFGLYDYVALTGNVQVKELIKRSLSTMHLLLDEFDTGFWTRANLLHRHLASFADLALQITLLEALSAYSGCEHCFKLASCWKGYQYQLGSRVRYLIAKCCTSVGSTLMSQIRSVFFPKTQVFPVLRVCVPITAFPVTGGMRTVLTKIAQATSGIWQMEYLTPYVGPDSERYVIHRFGKPRMSPSQFPMVWLYCFAGLRKLFSLLHHRASYDLILPQDAIFTGAFAALVARLAGVRVVCIDHGNLGLLRSRTYHAERKRARAAMPWLRRFRDRLLLIWYWPSLHLMACFAAHLVDHFVVPGAEGDGVEEMCRSLGIGSSRLTRFVNVIDVGRHTVPDPASRAEMREKNGIPADAIVISMVCRLAPEKGLDIALESISQALSALSSDQRTRVRVIFVGDGPLREQLEVDILSHRLSQTCILWGEATEETVISVLGLSDIFLFTSLRAAGYPLAILEAMASCCAVIASNEPLANVRMLAEGRGILVDVGDLGQIAAALVQLINDPVLRQEMGILARDYISVKHNPATFKRVWMRASYWSGLNMFLKVGMNVKDEESQGVS